MFVVVVVVVRTRLFEKTYYMKIKIAKKVLNNVLVVSKFTLATYMLLDKACLLYLRCKY